MKKLRISTLILAVIITSFLTLSHLPATAEDGRAQFDTGSAVMGKWVDLAGSKAAIKAVVRYTGSSVPENAGAVLVSSSSSSLPIWSWFDSGTIYYFTEDPSPKTNRDSSFMFNGLTNAETVDVSCFDTSETQDMEGMFANLKKVRILDVSNFDTSQVRCMYCMFYNCSSVEVLDVSRFNTQNTVYTSDSNYGSMCGMFIGCASLHELDLSSFDMTNTGWPYHTQNMFVGTTVMERLVLGPNCRFNGFTALDGNWTKEDDGTTLSGAQLCYMYNSANAMMLSGVWHRDLPEGHFYRTDGSLDEENLWEVHTPLDRFKGYCLNLNRFGVGETLDRILTENGGDVEQYLCSESEGSVHGYEPLGNDMREALITLIYYGWPNDGAGIQQKYSLSDRSFMEITQNAVWDFTDRYDDPVGPGYFEGDELSAYTELVSQTYTSIPEEYDLFLYISWDPTKQNLLSIMGVDDSIYGGVSVRKCTQDGSAYLAGAEFTVYDESGEAVTTMVTGNGGEAYLCRTDHWAGLPQGTYTVRETKAPAGYFISDKEYTFDISVPNEIVSIGTDTSKQDAAPEEMIFYDMTDDSYEGGGIGIIKKGQDGKMLAGAEFTIYSEDGTEAAVLVTNDAGIAVTGAKDLPYGTYTVRETRAPQGYKISDEVKTAEIGEETPFLSFTFTDGVKQGSVTLLATKILDVEGQSLKGGEFAFELTDANGTVLQTKYNDADGNIVFDEIIYTSADLGFANYHIREVFGNDNLYHYDPHQEDITVTIHDTEGDSLYCTVAYDSDGAVFTNSEAGSVIEIGIMKMKLNTSETVPGATLVLRDEGGRVISEWESTSEPHKVQLQSGKYTVTETSAPDGFAKADTVRFILGEDGTLELSGPGSFDGENMVLLVYDRSVESIKLGFTKRSSEDNSPLPGAAFTLTSTAESTYSASAVSGADGQLFFDGIESGIYTLKEDSPPEGYEKASGEWTVTVERFLRTAGTPNVDSEGNASGTYPISFTDKKTVTAPEGTEKIHVSLAWQTEDGYDYLEICNASGELIGTDADGNVLGDPGYPGRFWGGMDDGVVNHAEFDLSAGEVTFYFYSDPGVTAYGYHATVSIPDRITVTDPSGENVPLNEGMYDLFNVAKAAPETVVLSIVKKWENDENSAGNRPDSIEAVVLANGEETAHFTLSEENRWSAEAEFPKTDGNGEEIDYTVSEVPVKGYSSSVTFSEETFTFTIKNTYTGSGSDPGGSVPHTGYTGHTPACILAIAVSLMLLYIMTALQIRRRRQ